MKMKEGEGKKRFEKKCLKVEKMNSPSRFGEARKANEGQVGVKGRHCGEKLGFRGGIRVLFLDHFLKVGRVSLACECGDVWRFC